MKNLQVEQLEKLRQLAPEQQQQVADYLVRNDFRHFITAVFKELNPQTKFHHSWHLDLIAYYLMRTMPTDSPLNPEPHKPRIKRLIINVPPRSLKSLIVNIAFRAFILGHYPHERFLSASYNQSLSAKFNMQTMHILNTPWYRRIFPETQLSRQTQDQFVTTQQGSSIATSTGTTKTGEGGNILIADDLIDPKIAKSETQRLECLEWIPSSFFSRINDKADGGVVILIMQRLHEEDPTGFLLDQNETLPPNRQWVHVCLPQIAEKDEEWTFYGQTVRRKEGEPLNPQRDTPEAIQSAITEFGGISGWSAQCQQRPTPKDGGLLKPSLLQSHNFTLPLSENTLKEHKMTIYQSWDTAIKDTARADWSVCTTWGVTASQYHLLNVFRKKLEYPQLKQAIQTQAAMYGVPPAAILIEDKASGQQLIQELRLSTQLPIIPVKALPQKDRKLIAAAACAYPIEAGLVTVPENKEKTPWWLDFEHEMLFFPNGKHDDQIDSLSQFINWIQLNNINQYRITALCKR